MLVISKEILKCINDAGYKAYMVGGVVRDYLLGNDTIDVDICTSATPKELLEIFPMATPHIEYGCVKLFYKEVNFEITTFRVEKKYENRRPVEIEYVTSLEKDLARRDFTINTLCMDCDGNIIDILGAKADLNKKILRCVSNPDKKFSEDPLRILRGIRFSANLGFKIEKDTLKAIKKNKKLLNNISYNKKREELDKIFASKKCSAAINLIKRLKLDKELELKGISKLKISDNILIMWVQLDCIDKYPFSNNEKDQIEKIRYLINNRKNLIDNYVIYKYGAYLTCSVDKIYGGKNIDKINIINSNLAINSSKDIDISVDEIIELIKREKGSWISELIKDLERQIVNNKLENNKNKIKEYLIKRYIN